LAPSAVPMLSVWSPLFPIPLADSHRRYRLDCPCAGPWIIPCDRAAVHDLATSCLTENPQLVLGFLDWGSTGRVRETNRGSLPVRPLPNWTSEPSNEIGRRDIGQFPHLRTATAEVICGKVAISDLACDSFRKQRCIVTHSRWEPNQRPRGCTSFNSAA
jgi:hypothetical protein